MRNWSGNQVWSPDRTARPATEAEVAALIRAAPPQPIRPAGSLHSFTPLCPTTGTSVRLDRLAGPVAILRGDDCTRVRAPAGTTLRSLNEQLAACGLALENMGDIDVQTIAGAISTGTHGTGARFGNLATQVTGLRFVNGMGEVVACSETESPELLRAARLSLGLLGILTEVELRCVPAYDLELQIDVVRLSELIDRYPYYNTTHRHFEAYWFPHTDRVLTKKLDRIPPGRRTGRITDRLHDLILENYGLLSLCELSRLPGQASRASKIAAALAGRYRKVDASYRVFSTTRLVRFNEMEYAIPLESFPDAFRAVTECINRRHPEIFFPVEVRFVRGDRASYLSPAWGRDTVYIACHVYHKKEYAPYLREMEAIFRAYDGRPHWGKLHWLGYERLSAIYPEFRSFEAYRMVHDPDGLFMSDRLRGLFAADTNADIRER